MTDAKLRVEDELAFIAEKITALEAFVFRETAPKISKLQIELLVIQHGAMTAYKAVLEARLQHWDDV